MRKRPERIPGYLHHILDESNSIDDNISGFDLKRFLESRPVQDAVSRNLEIIGAASHRILVADEEFEERHPKIELTRA